MRPLPKELIAELEHEVPEFVKAVQYDKANTILMTLHAFANEPDLFFACVTYATQNGKSVTIAAAPANEPA